MTHEFAKIRSAIYRLIALGLLTYPNEETISPYHEQDVMELLKEISPTASEQIKTFLSDFDGNWRTLKLEFDALFNVPTERYLTPYESVYTGDPPTSNGKGKKKDSTPPKLPLLMGKAAIEVEHLYRSHGLQVAPALKELPDHIAVELLFMAHLCELEAEVSKNNENNKKAKALLSSQQRFMTEHLTKWAYRFFEKMKLNSHSCFFKGLAALGEDFIKKEEELLTNKTTRHSHKEAKTNIT